MECRPYTSVPFMTRLEVVPEEKDTHHFKAEAKGNSL